MSVDVLRMKQAQEIEKRWGEASTSVRSRGRSLELAPTGEILDAGEKPCFRGIPEKDQGRVKVLHKISSVNSSGLLRRRGS